MRERENFVWARAAGDGQQFELTGFVTRPPRAMAAPCILSRMINFLSDIKPGCINLGFVNQPANLCLDQGESRR